MLSLVLLSCTDTTEPDYLHTNNFLGTVNIDGTNLLVAGIQHQNGSGFTIEDVGERPPFFRNAVFTPDGTKLTNGYIYMDVDGSNCHFIAETDRRIRDFCIDSSSSNCYIISSLDDYPSEIIKYNYNTNSSEILIDTIDADAISISTDDKLLLVSKKYYSFYGDVIYIIDIASKTILKELSFSLKNRKIFSNDNTEIYYKDNLDESIKAINIETLEIRRVAPHGEISIYNADRTRFIYHYNSTYELLELNGDSYSYRTLSNSPDNELRMSINRAGTIAIYKTTDGVMANYIDGIGEVYLGRNLTDAAIAPEGEKYLFYLSSKSSAVIKE